MLPLPRQFLAQATAFLLFNWLLCAYRPALIRRSRFDHHRLFFFNAIIASHFSHPLKTPSRNLRSNIF
ncbi:14-3-3-like protein [Gossypium australe]|uniref:14-3-3-like protein n=1 Tax=Gossypium australe TaxID=47621 RepID=A0A5B6U7I5_9ROSI|nr:14-3-3-like protein [Gossypium australe]